ncbi:MAG: BON domain-containing protein [Burkholderiales bacterium]|nr:BON domain-containing protein [Burkholderiales bacterium]
MNTPLRNLLSISIATVAAVGLLGCEQKTTSQSPDGTSTTTTTTTVPNPAPQTTAEVKADAKEATADAKAGAKEMAADVKSAAKEVGNDMSRAADKAGTVIQDSAITATVKTALLADPDVKGLKIDVDTKNGVVTLKGTADKSVNRDRAVAIAKDTSGVKSVDDQLVVKASS